MLQCHNEQADVTMPYKQANATIPYEQADATMPYKQADVKMLYKHADATSATDCLTMASYFLFLTLATQACSNV